MGKDDPIHIIVVDDEPISAEDLGELIRQTYAERWRLDVRTAHSAKAVLRLVEEQPCDILISDIQMPGMSGLKLSEQLRSLFPEMRVLFLTGYDDFSFAYEAFRQNPEHYLLKTEGDEAILAAVGEAIERFWEHRLMVDHIHEAENRYVQMLPAYRRELLIQLLMNADVPQNDGGTLGGELYLVVTRYEAQDGAQATRTRLIIQSAVENILAGSLEDSALWMEGFLLGAEIIWVISLRGGAPYTEVLFQLVRKARKRLDEQLALKLFFIVSDGAVKREHLGEKYAEMQSMLTRRIQKGAEGVAIRKPEGPASPLSEEQARRMGRLRQQLGLCERDIRDSAFAQLRGHVQPVLQYLEDSSSASDPFAAELEAALQSLLLAYVNQNGLTWVLSETGKYASLGTAEYVRRVIEVLERECSQQADYAARSIARYVTEYIHDHLSEDVGTAVLAERMGYSAGYLSRVFKQQEGVSIHEYATQARMNLARELLCNTNLRVYEIASSCGYDNTAYFIKVFKSHTGQTPQEYKQDAVRRSHAGTD